MSSDEMNSNSDNQASVVEQAPVASSAEEPKKRPARRVRKTVVEGDASQVSPSQPGESGESGESVAAEKPKRRPGRPRKDSGQQSAKKEASEGAVRDDAPQNEDSDTASDAKPKRRPGRPRKTAEPSETQRSSEVVEAEGAAPAAEEPRKRPRRSAKARLSEDIVPDDSADSAAMARLDQEKTSADSASATDQDDQPRRRPGRPRKSISMNASVEKADERAEAGESGESAASEESSSGRMEPSERDAKKQRDDRDLKGDSYVRSDRFEKRSKQNQRERRISGKQQGFQRQQSQNNRGDGHQGGRLDQHASRRQRRTHANGREPIAPKTTMEDLSKLKVAELREKAAELFVDATGLKKAELVSKVYEASVRAEGFIEVEGILDIMQDGYGFLRTKGYLPSENDVYVGLSTIRRNGLRKGDLVAGQTRPKRENEKYAALQQVGSVNGIPVDQMGQRVRFGDLTPVFPDECLTMEHGRTTITARVIDLVSPIGKGQRGLIVSPPKAGKTTVLKDIAAAITANNPEVHLMCLLVDERPEEVTDMQRSIKGEVIASTFDMPTENHIVVSELVIERAKRLVEMGEDVVVLLDSLTRLARAYNLAQPASGRILSGGVDSTALYPPKRFLGAARNIEGGGSLTILASALIETGSKMDEVIFEEFKGTGNMELKLDRSLADRRVFPAIDPVASGTRREDLLLNPQEAPLIWAVRRILSNMNSTERAMDMLIKSLKQTNDNQEFLLRTAKKAQSQRDSENLEL